MARSAANFPLTARSAVVFAAALAMLLPLPARCAACPTNAGANCARCAAANADDAKSRAPRPCSRHRAKSGDEAAAGDLIRSVSNHALHCGCHARPVHRTLPPSEQLVLVPDLFAALPVLPLPAAIEAHPGAVALTLGDLPPPIPHRILHCSWLI